MEQLQKASLCATFADGSMEFVDIQFNPGDYTLEKGAQNAEINIPGLDSPLLQFVRLQDERLTLELFFDTTDDGMGTGATSVTTLTDPIYSLIKINPTDHAPPLVTFLWNSKIAGNDLAGWPGGGQKRNEFTGVVENIRQKFTMFSSEGVPLRATLTLTIREYKTLDDQIEKLNLQSPDRTHSHVLLGSETLASVAAQFYLDPGSWRAIAAANGIEDPRRLTPGTFLTVPPLS